MLVKICLATRNWFKRQEGQLFYHSFLDEILLLVEQLIDISENRPALSKAKQEYEIAKSLIAEGKRSESARYAVKAYDILYF